MATKARNAYDLLRHYPDATVLLLDGEDVLVGGPWYDHITRIFGQAGWPMHCLVDGVTWSKVGLVVEIAESESGVLQVQPAQYVYGYRASKQGILLLPVSVD